VRLYRAAPTVHPIPDAVRRPCQLYHLTRNVDDPLCAIGRSWSAPAGVAISHSRPSFQIVPAWAWIGALILRIIDGVPNSAARSDA
jgi:hypothetical protein